MRLSVEELQVKLNEPTRDHLDLLLEWYEGKRKQQPLNPVNVYPEHLCVLIKEIQKLKESKRPRGRPRKTEESVKEDA